MRPIRRCRIRIPGLTAGVISAVAATILSSAPTPAGAVILQYITAQKETGGVDGLTAAQSLALSGDYDGSRLYVAANGDSAVSYFTRDVSTGLLTYGGLVQDGVGGVDGLANATFVQTALASPSGKRYVFASGINDAAFARFRDDGTTLTFLGFSKDGVGGVDGLAGARGIAAIPATANGFDIYVAGRVDSAIAVFRQNADETISFREVHRDGVSGVDGLAAVEAVAVTFTNVYGAGFADNAVAVFTRDESTGLLTFVEMQKDGVNGVDGIAHPISLAVSPDEKHLYVAGSADNSIAWFSRNTTTGALTYGGKVTDGVGGVDGLAGAYSVAVDRDGGLVYAAGINDNAIAVFSRDASTGALTFLEVFKDGVNGVDGLAAVYQVAARGEHVYAASFTDSAVAIFGKVCGNVVIDPGEECDDGDSRSGNCCSATCQLEPQCQRILGKSITVKDPDPADATKRSVFVKGVERASTDAVLGNPAVNNMAVILQATGDHPNFDVYYLPAGANWTTLSGGQGFKYSDPRNDNGPVKRVYLRKSSGGTFTVKLILRNDLIATFPPNLGRSVEIWLTTFGARYCIGLGGTAGGAIPASANNAKIFKIRASGTAPAVDVPCTNVLP